MGRIVELRRYSITRVVLAFLLAPLSASLILGLAVSLRAFPAASLPEAIEAGLGIALVAYLGFGLLPALVLGVPAYLFLRHRVSHPLWPVSAGALIAAFPYSVWVGLLGIADPSHPGAALRGAMPSLLAAPALGAFAGWVFWFVAAWRPVPRS